MKTRQCLLIGAATTIQGVDVFAGHVFLWDADDLRLAEAALAHRVQPGNSGSRGLSLSLDQFSKAPQGLTYFVEKGTVKLLYLDESGNHDLRPTKINPRYPVFALGGVVVDRAYERTVIAPQ